MYVVVDCIIACLLVAILTGLLLLIIRLGKYTESIRESNRISTEAVKVEVRDIITKGIDMHKSLYYGNMTKELETDLLTNTFVNLRNAIKGPCRATMDELDGYRLAIYNGNVSTHGINFFKMTCICEKIKLGSGIKEQYLNHTNIAINLFDDMMDKLISNGKFIIINNKDILDSNEKIFISSNKIKYSIAVSIFDNNNNILGFILIEFAHEYDRAVASKEVNILESLEQQIMPVLSYSNYFDAAIVGEEKPKVPPHIPNKE